MCVVFILRWMCSAGSDSEILGRNKILRHLLVFEFNGFNWTFSAGLQILRSVAWVSRKLRNARIKLVDLSTKKRRSFQNAAFFYFGRKHYIMPSMPPPPGIAIGLSSLISDNTHSVVNNIPAIDAAFSKATRVTFVGSITPSSNNLPYVSVRAL